MEYEKLLNSAFEKVNKTEVCNRFELKKVNIFHEGYNKTWITNFLQIALCLRRDQEHLARFLSKNLASYGEIVGERLFLGRKIFPEMVQKKIEFYLNEYVKCSKCGKPDTELLEEDGKVHLKCLACGIKNEVHKI